MGAPEREAPKRLRAADVIAELENIIRALTERHTSSAPQAAVDLTRNAKGETQIGVKLTANMDGDLAAFKRHAAEVLALAIRTYDEAAKRYPPGA